jgi:hypothetical protein
MMNTKTLVRKRFEILDPETERNTINRLLAAAVINAKFCNLLLCNPRIAIETGFSDEQFDLSPQTRDIIVSIHASSLKEFAQELIEQLHGTPLAA